jgi:hypothetical protein
MWWLACVGAGVLGLLSALAAAEPASVFPLAISVGAMGALAGLGCRLSCEPVPEEHLGRAVARSAGLGVIVALAVVLPFVALGRAWIAGALLLCVTCPPSARWCRSRWRGLAFMAGPTDDEAELWELWAMSSRALEHPLSAADATALVGVRQQVLDELVARRGSIPKQLWSGGPAPPDAGARPTGHA